MKKCSKCKSRSVYFATRKKKICFEKIFLLLLVMCISLSFASCSSKNNVETETTSKKVTTTTETTTLTETTTETVSKSKATDETSYTDKNGNKWVVKSNIPMHYLDMDQKSFANEIAKEYDNELLYFSSTQNTNSGTGNSFTKYTYSVLQDWESVSVNICVEDDFIPNVYVSTSSQSVSSGIGCLIDTLYPIVEIMSGDKSVWNSSQKLSLAVNLADTYDRKEQLYTFDNLAFQFSYSDEVIIAVYKIAE